MSLALWVILGPLRRGQAQLVNIDDSAFRVFFFNLRHRQLVEAVAATPPITSGILLFVTARKSQALLMGSEEAKDPLKDVDWKSIGSETTKKADGGTVTQKRLPKKMRQIPEYYFLPRKSLPSAIAFYGSFIVAGVGAGMLLEVWIDKKVKEDGGVIWDFGK